MRVWIVEFWNGEDWCLGGAFPLRSVARSWRHMILNGTKTRVREYVPREEQR